jgi:two-component system response regulator LytT
MQPLRIGIVEDQRITAEDIAEILRQIGYLPSSAASNYDDAITMVETFSPDLLLIDIALKGKLDGIDLAFAINKNYNLPFIFLTANSDQLTVERAKEVKPYAYIVKPFTENDLYTAIEIASNNHNKQRSQNNSSALNDAMLIKDGNVFHKVKFDDIVYVESDHVYLNIYTMTRQYLVRNKLDDFILEIDNCSFIRVHRSYVININYLDSISSQTLSLGEKEIPIQKNYKDALLRKMRLMK